MRAIRPAWWIDRRYRRSMFGKLSVIERQPDKQDLDAQNTEITRRSAAR